MKLKRRLLGIIILTLSSIGLLADTTVPMKLNVSAVLSYSDGTLINSVSTENIRIGLYTNTTEFVWRKEVGVWFRNGLIEATLSGTGTSSNGGSIVLNESLFENEALKVGFVITEDGVDKVALVELVSQPYAIKSASSDYAHKAGSSDGIKGIQISDVVPSENSIMVYSEPLNQWVPDQLSVIEIPSNDVNEISGSFKHMTVKRILGKTLTSAVRIGSVMPTGAVLMYSPDVDAPNGAFHPSSGNPQPGEVLTWDGFNDVWMPSTNRIEKMTDVRLDYSTTPVNNIFKYDPTDDGGRYKLVEIGINYLKDVTTHGLTDGQFLRYDAGIDRWKGASMSLNSLTDVRTSMVSPTGKYLYYTGTQWDVKTIKLQELSDIESTGMGAGKIMIGRSDGTKFEFKDFVLESLNNVNISGKSEGDALVWKGDSLGWKVEKNKVSEINELNGFNISSPSNKYMYHNGTEWVAKELNILTTMKDLTDTVITNVADKHIIYYDTSLQKWRNNPFQLSMVNDIEFNWEGQGTNPAKKFLVYNNGKWKNAEIGVTEMKDVTITDASEGQIMVYRNNRWVNEANQTLSLSVLNDVSSQMLPTNGDHMKYNGTEWTASPVKLHTLSDVPTTGLAENKVLVGNSSGTGFQYKAFTLDALSNVDPANKVVGSTVVWKGDALGWKMEAATTTMTDLTDTTMGTLADDHIMAYDVDTSKWRNQALTLGFVSDVEFDWVGQGTNPSKKFLVYNNGKWKNSDIGIDEMNDVTIANAINGQVMVWNNGQWVNQDPKSKVSSLTDVTLTNLTNGQVLQYDSTTQRWVNKSAATSVAFGQIGASATDQQIDVIGHLVPGLSSGPAYDLGSLTNAWRNIYVSTGNVYFGADGNRASLSYDSVNQEMVIGREGSGSDHVNIKMLNGYALIGEHSEAIGTVHPIAFWDDPNVIESNDSFVFDSINQRMGIGATSPARQLHIDTNANNEGILLSTQGANNANVGISFSSGAIATNSGNGMKLSYNAASNANNGALIIQKSHNDGTLIDHLFHFERSGNFGIGKTPEAPLDVNGLARANRLFVGISGSAPTTNANVKLHVDGDAQVDGAIYISGGSDLAEGFHIVASEKVEPGTVVSIDPNNIGKLIVTNEANDTKVAGVVSGGNGIKAGLIMTQTGTLADGEYPIALTGRVWVKCTTENGAIGVGDLLTTASTPGHAMKADVGYSQGAILGKAMSPCSKENMVLTLISLQ